MYNELYYTKKCIGKLAILLISITIILEELYVISGSDIFIFVIAIYINNISTVK